jgi:hypothetical protein
MQGTFVSLSKPLQLSATCTLHPATNGIAYELLQAPLHKSVWHTAARVCEVYLWRLLQDREARHHGQLRTCGYDLDADLALGRRGYFDFFDDQRLQLPMVAYGFSARVGWWNMFIPAVLVVSTHLFDLPHHSGLACYHTWS